MNNIEFSIIVPVYNIQVYIEECLMSIRNQDIKDIEIICVNDCSTDNSLNILNKIIKIDDRIKIINHERNKGLSAARNTGIREAKGKYILFIDGDDILVENSLKRIYLQIKNKDLDILRCNFIYFYNNRNIYTENKRYDIDKRNIINGEELFVSLYKSKEYKPMAWMNIYRREFLLKNNLFFCDGILHEDVEFTPRAFARAKNTDIANINLIIYRIRDNSITSTFNPKKNRDLLYIIILLKEMIENEVSSKETKRYMYELISSNLITVINNINENEKNYYFKIIKDNKLIETLLLSRNWKNIIRYLIMKIFSVKNYIKLSKLMISK
ncbi:glycosyltransferase family 2 protein [Clostridium sp.]|uniref:glycosyltransferase family 2 protein n=1 Tax=Clostridium sp. TaxID=1506 RepID=UPI00290D7B04|nr:glycosyltransferase [Clostridium sp.]MDU3526247.1 glycosyltransferase [Clostridium sp.]MDU3548474.1 glycosyltransferase [Clostridium sp.]